MVYPVNVSSSFSPIRARQAVPENEETLEKRFDKIRNLYFQMTGKNLDAPKFKEKLEKALEEGGISREEFEEIFGMDITKEAFLAFTGGKETIANLEDLKYYMQEFIKFNRMTGIPFAYFAQATRVTIISKEELAHALKSLGKDGIEKLLQKHQFMVKEMLQYFKQKQYEKVTVEDIMELEDADLEWLALGLFFKWYENTHEDKLQITKKLRDPLVARKFAGTLFKRYLTEGKRATKNELSLLSEFADQVEELRKSVEDIALSGINPAAFEAEFAKILALSKRFAEASEDDKAKVKSQIMEKLRDLRTKSGEWYKKIEEEWKKDGESTEEEGTAIPDKPLSLLYPPPVSFIV